MSPCFARGRASAISLLKAAGVRIDLLRGGVFRARRQRRFELLVQGDVVLDPLEELHARERVGIDARRLPGRGWGSGGWLAGLRRNGHPGGHRERECEHADHQLR